MRVNKYKSILHNGTTKETLSPLGKHPRLLFYVSIVHVNGKAIQQLSVTRRASADARDAPDEYRGTIGISALPLHLYKYMYLYQPSGTTQTAKMGCRVTMMIRVGQKQRALAPRHK